LWLGNSEVEVEGEVGGRWVGVEGGWLALFCCYGNLLVGFFVLLCGFGADSERVSLSDMYYIAHCYASTEPSSR